MKKGKPLEGKTIVITRARHQAGEFTRRLSGLGAQVIEFPTIEIAPPDSWGPLDKAIDDVHGYDWVIFTSANGVKPFVRRLHERGRQIGELKGIRFCAIGPRTAQEMREENIEVHLVPSEYRAEAVVEKMKKEGLAGKRILLARAKKAREVLPRELENHGARVDVVVVYQTVQPTSDTSRFFRLLEEREIDVVAFTSSSTVSNFMDMFSANRAELLRRLRKVAIAVIGPITEETAVKLALPVRIRPTEYTIPALTDAIVAYFCSTGSKPGRVVS
jgi:uroporphyrinogen III methyltransferase/synthase